MRRTLSLLVPLLLVAGFARADERPDLPLEDMAAGEREAVVAVAEAPTVRCAIEERRVRCGPRVYGWLLGHLPLAARALRALELGDYRIEATAEGFRIDDRAGASARCRNAWEEPGHLVVLAPGELDVALLPRILGTGVVVVRYAPDEQDPEVLRCQARVLFRVESRVLHLAAAPFRRLLERVLREKLDQLIAAAAALAEAVEAEPWAVYRALEAAGEASTEELGLFRQRFLLH